MAGRAPLYINLHQDAAKVQPGCPLEIDDAVPRGKQEWVSETGITNTNHIIIQVSMLTRPGDRHKIHIILQ